MQIDAVRCFNRFYTRRVGALRAGLLGSAHPLPEARLLYEIGQRRQCSAGELAAELDLDAGYLSRLLQGLRRRGFLAAKRAPDDARRSLLSLTEKGRKSFAQLDLRSREEVTGMLGALPVAEQGKLVGAMQAVETLLSGRNKEPLEITLRGHRPGDIGWVI